MGTGHDLSSVLQNIQREEDVEMKILLIVLLVAFIAVCEGNQLNLSSIYFILNFNYFF